MIFGLSFVIHWFDVPTFLTFTYIHIYSIVSTSGSDSISQNRLFVKKCSTIYLAIRKILIQTK